MKSQPLSVELRGCHSSDARVPPIVCCNLPGFQIFPECSKSHSLIKSSIVRQPGPSEQPHIQLLLDLNCNFLLRFYVMTNAHQSGFFCKMVWEAKF